MLANCYIVVVNGDEVKSLREKLKMTQGELAKKLGVHRITVAKWEAGANVSRAIELALKEIERNELGL